MNRNTGGNSDPCGMFECVCTFRQIAAHEMYFKKDQGKRFSVFSYHTHTAMFLKN